MWKSEKLGYRKEMSTRYKRSERPKKWCESSFCFDDGFKMVHRYCNLLQQANLTLYLSAKGMVRFQVSNLGLVVIKNNVNLLTT